MMTLHDPRTETRMAQAQVQVHHRRNRGIVATPNKTAVTSITSVDHILTCVVAIRMTIVEMMEIIAIMTITAHLKVISLSA